MKDLRWFAESLADNVTALGDVDSIGSPTFLYFDVVSPAFIYARVNDEEPSFIIMFVEPEGNYDPVHVCWDGGKEIVVRSERAIANILMREHLEHLGHQKKE